MSDFSAFAEMERRSWSDAARAFGYVQLFASAPDQAIKGLLDAAGAGRDLRALDLCCGQGNVSEALLNRGCRVVGVDFSSAMLAFARKRARKSIFIQADAQDLPFPDAEFDLVVSNLGVCHIPDQPRALAEARRVLRSGGRFAMTVWCGPESSPCFASVYAAVNAHGDPHVFAPAGRIFISSQDLMSRLNFCPKQDSQTSMQRRLIAYGISRRQKICLRFTQRAQFVQPCSFPNNRPKIWLRYVLR
jgi:ubiquinone/menaquinone biosynthesis C-methylase UbiE